MATRPLVFGTTAACIAATEQKLGVQFPKSLVEWLLAHNQAAPIFAVTDPRDHRTAMGFEYFVPKFYEYYPETQALKLLPIVDDADGFFYVMDLSRRRDDGEAPIIRICMGDPNYAKFIGWDVPALLKHIKERAKN